MCVHAPSKYKLCVCVCIHSYVRACASMNTNKSTCECAFMIPRKSPHVLRAALCVDPLSLTERLQPSLYGRPRESLRGRQVPARERSQSEPPHRGQPGLLSCILCVAVEGPLLVSHLLSRGHAERCLQSEMMTKTTECTLFIVANCCCKFPCCFLSLNRTHRSIVEKPALIKIEHV